MHPLFATTICRLPPLLELSGIATDEAEHLHRELVSLYTPGTLLGQKLQCQNVPTMRSPDVGVSSRNVRVQVDISDQVRHNPGCII